MSRAAWRRRHYGDVVLATTLAVLTAAWTLRADATLQPDRPMDAWGMTMVVGTAAALAVRRRMPLVTLAVATALTSAYLLLGYTYGPVLVSFLVAVYTAARHLPLRASAPAAALAVGALLLHLLTSSAALPGFLGLVPATAWVVVPFAVGTTIRVTTQSMEQTRAEALRQRLSDERLRVAQEVHDIVGHGLAAIKMQADIALHVLPRQPAQAEQALRAISGTSTQALNELRATLDVVSGNDGEASRAPGPGLGRLEDLRQRMSQAGVHVDLSTSGAVRPLPAEVDLAGYRVVQESLTNVLKHARAPTATVRVEYGQNDVTLLVENAADDGPARHDGMGIPGMRKRVENLGGTFSAGPVDGGRFAVRARIPTGEPA
jgi:signal transduction histidine kinase